MLVTVGFVKNDGSDLVFAANETFDGEPSVAVRKSAGVGKGAIVLYVTAAYHRIFDRAPIGPIYVPGNLPSDQLGR